MIATATVVAAVIQAVFQTASRTRRDPASSWVTCPIAKAPSRTKATWKADRIGQIRNARRPQPRTIRASQ